MSQCTSNGQMQLSRASWNHINSHFACAGNLLIISNLHFLTNGWADIDISTRHSAISIANALEEPQLYIRSSLWSYIWWSTWSHYCPACRTSLTATRFWVVMICPIIKWLTVLEFSFILFDLYLFIIILNFILNYVPIVTFWILTYHKIWILLIIFCFIWSYWIIYFLTCLEVFWSVVS